MKIEAGKIKSWVERVERLLEERAGINGDIKDIYTEIKSNEHDAKAIRKLIQRRAMDPADRALQDDLLTAYTDALDGKIRALDAISKGASTKEAAKAGGISTGSVSALRRGVQKSRSVNHDPITGEITETADGNPPSGGEGTAEITSGPGIASATHSEVAPNEDARAAQSLPLPDADGVSRAGTHSEAETGSATVVTTGNLDALSPPVSAGSPDSCSTDAEEWTGSTQDMAWLESQPEVIASRIATDAARLRAQIPSSTDPERLEREAERAASAVLTPDVTTDDPGPMPTFLRRTVSA